MMLIKFSTDLGSGAAPRSLLHFRSLDIFHNLAGSETRSHTAYSHYGDKILENRVWVQSRSLSFLDSVLRSLCGGRHTRGSGALGVHPTLPPSGRLLHQAEAAGAQLLGLQP